MHASKRPPDVILRKKFTRPSAALTVIESLGTKLTQIYEVPTFWAVLEKHYQLNLGDLYKMLPKMVGLRALSKQIFDAKKLMWRLCACGMDLTC